jgi:hypothetical protein
MGICMSERPSAASEGKVQLDDADDVIKLCDTLVSMFCQEFQRNGRNGKDWLDSRMWDRVYKELGGFAALEYYPEPIPTWEIGNAR